MLSVFASLGLTVKRGKDFGMGTDECVAEFPAPGSLLRWCRHTHRDLRRSCRPADTHTSGTQERCGGLENGSGEVKNGGRADCPDERH